MAQAPPTARFDNQQRRSINTTIAALLVTGHVVIRKCQRPIEAIESRYHSIDACDVLAFVQAITCTKIQMEIHMDPKRTYG
jgi:hypothetical protein